MKRQELFNDVVKALWEQKAFSIGGRADGGSDEYCAYRGANGTACGIGLLIPDALYHEDLEMNDAGCVFRQLKPMAEKYEYDINDGTDAFFVNNLQSVLHDELRDDVPDEDEWCDATFKRAAAHFAVVYDLKMPRL
jgi:hypothetical protein